MACTDLHVWAVLLTCAACKQFCHCSVTCATCFPHTDLHLWLFLTAVWSTCAASLIICCCTVWLLSTAVSQGKLLPDNIIFDLLSKRLELGVTLGERGFVLDGFPRTRLQAEILDLVADIDLAINLKCREDILIKRCLGRRVCTQCGKNFNVASIDVKGTNGGSRIHMPPVLPPYSCLGKLVTSMSDTEEILKEKLRIYSEQSKALEDHYCKQRKLLNFEVPGDIKEAWPGLLSALDLKDIDTTSQRLNCLTFYN